MRQGDESRTILVGAVVAVVVLLLFTLSLGAVLLTSWATDRGAGVAPAPSPGPTTVVAGQSGVASDATSTTGLAPTSALTVEASEPTPRPPEPSAASESPTTTATQSTPDAATSTTTRVPSTPSPPPSATTTPGPTPTSAPPSATAIVASIEWPTFLPDGMTFAAVDSWPFRLVGPGREGEPFLIFRGGERWLSIRNQGDASQPIPRSATSETRTIAGAQATVIKYLGGGFKVILDRGGRRLQLSGEELADDDIIRVIESLRPLSSDALRLRLTQETAQATFGVSLLWPSYLPEGFQLAPAETIVELNGDSVDGYRVSFNRGDGLIQVGGGTVAPPTFTGTREQITAGPLTGELTYSQRRFLLVITAGSGATNTSPTFPDDVGAASLRLPLVQRGPIFIAAENVDRQQFDRIVEGLTAVQSRVFLSRARGQSGSSLTYLWPATLPPGYAIDLTTVQIGWDDFVLQGGTPYFAIAVRGPDQDIASIKGGYERTDSPFIVPEGAGVERTVVNIRGHTVSAAQTPDGSTLFWLENNWPYTVTSTSLTIAQLTTIAEGLQPIDEDEFFRRVK